MDTNETQYLWVVNLRVMGTEGEAQPYAIGRTRQEALDDALATADEIAAERCEIAAECYGDDESEEREEEMRKHNDCHTQLTGNEGQFEAECGYQSWTLHQIPKPHWITT